MALRFSDEYWGDQEGTLHTFDDNQSARPYFVDSGSQQSCARDGGRSVLLFGNHQCISSNTPHLFRGLLPQAALSSPRYER